MKNLFNKIYEGYKSWLNRRRWQRASKQAARILNQTKAKWPNCEGARMVTDWPAVSGTDAGFLIKGKTTIMWGTNGIISTPFPAGGGFYNVIRASMKPIIDRTKLPNGVGVTSSDVFVQDGVTWEIVVRDDSALTPPVIGTTWSVVDIAGLLGAQGLVYTGRVVEPDYEVSLKAAGERTVMLDNLILIDSQTSGAQTPR